MWNDFMPEDIKAVQKKQQEEIDGAVWLNDPYVPPDVFKVSAASSSTEACNSKAKPPTRTYGRAVPSKKRLKVEPDVAPVERTPSEIEWDTIHAEEEEIMNNPDLWTWV